MIYVQLKFPEIENANSGVCDIRNDIPPNFEYTEKRRTENPANMSTNWSLSVRTTAENPPENAYIRDKVAPRQRAVNFGIFHT